MIKKVDLDRGDMLGVYYKGKLACRLAVTCIDDGDTLVVDERLEELGQLPWKQARDWFDRRWSKEGETYE